MFRVTRALLAGRRADIRPNCSRRSSLVETPEIAARRILAHCDSAPVAGARYNSRSVAHQVIGIGARVRRARRSTRGQIFQSQAVRVEPTRDSREPIAAALTDVAVGQGRGELARYGSRRQTLIGPWRHVVPG